MDRLDSHAIRVPGAEVRVIERCGSTNSVLLAERYPGHPVLLAAEAQTAGRGRRGRRWHSAPGADVALSLAAPVRRPLRELPGLSVVAGVAAARALRALGVRAVRLEWPNDLMVGAAKIGGILVETRGAGAGTLLAVIGVGINCRGAPPRPRRRATSLADCVQPPPSRNAVIERVARELLAALPRFEAAGLAPFVPEWEALAA